MWIYIEKDFIKKHFRISQTLFHFFGPPYITANTANTANTASTASIASKASTASTASTAVTASTARTYKTAHCINVYKLKFFLLISVPFIILEV